MEKRWIWPFELLDKLGEGGMGVVYRARYVVDDRHVAVKLLPPNIANETILSRFERELEILKTLRHPNIVRCFGGKAEGNQHFYAMELVEGGTLDRLLEERGRLSWETAIQFALQMASGLSYAHERGVVHRDVKPGNFLLSTAGKIKLSDFGLATVEAGTKITAAGKTMGTFPYMAPEQIRGRPPVSAQTDLYALGCVIFEMLTGRTPFIGETPAEVMHKHLEDVPSRIAEFAPDCPMPLEALVRDLLQKDPADRPESAFVVAQRLMDVTEVVEVISTKTRTADVLKSRTMEAPTIGGLPRVLPATPLSGHPVGGNARRRWLVPLLGALLCLSLAWNVHSAGSRTESKRAEQLWIQAFNSPRPEVREEAAKALGDIAHDSPEALKALTDALADERWPVRMTAVEGLMAAGPTARAAVADLMRLQKTDDNTLVRQKVNDALLAIEHAPETPSKPTSVFVWILSLILIGGIIFIAIMFRRQEPAGRPQP